MLLFWQLPIEHIKEGRNYSALGVDPAQLSRKLVLPSYIPPEVPWFWDVIYNIYNLDEVGGLAIFQGFEIILVADYSF